MSNDDDTSSKLSSMFPFTEEELLKNLDQYDPILELIPTHTDRELGESS
ncbi:hypothetical protein EGK58_001435 [Acinetobacter variabilis]|nr:MULTISPECIES: hypothetical protein [Acinetobacter]MDC5100611.1 hypothetical protein [Acinetobacter baumannii]MCU4364567.1 hypothetical protein [Acinetobacter variabilis]MCU4374478.1 hypothetical protein [Acinetobacter variabilis]MDC5511338.1 hypothetical protein [Acinetobacter baumannii]QKW81410.1 hypothetical protein FOC32_03200 [Acinetobacter sp. FDAARGOS_724]